MNFLTGGIPELNSTAMKTLNLAFNALSGPLPASLARSALTTLSVAHNRLTGSIPLALANVKMSQLDLRNNAFDILLTSDLRAALNGIGQVYGVEGYTSASLLNAGGTTPAEETALLLAWKRLMLEDPYGFLRSWKVGGNPCGAEAWDGIQCACDGATRECSIVRIDLGSANIKGTLPADLGDLRQVTIFWINGNRFSGPIPESIGSMTQMTSWATRGNFLEGPLPRSMELLTKLNTILAQYNRHTGPIPAGLANMPQLTRLNLAFNQFNGTIPAFLGQLTALSDLILANNKLSGKVPAELARLADFSLQVMDVRNNNLVTDIALYSSEELVELAKIPGIQVSKSAVQTEAPDSNGSTGSGSDEDFPMGAIIGIAVGVGLVLIVVFAAVAYRIGHKNGYHMMANHKVASAGGKMVENPAYGEFPVNH